jgi:hypothetical protein
MAERNTGHGAMECDPRAVVGLRLRIAQLTRKSVAALADRQRIP